MQYLSIINKVKTILPFLPMLFLSPCLQAATDNHPVLFAPYKDATLNFDWNRGIISTAVTGELKPLLDVFPKDKAAIVLAFATGQCGQEKWGTGITAQQIQQNLQQFAQNKQPYIISTGGQVGTFSCDKADLFKAFVESYKTNSLIGFDFDIEHDGAQQDVPGLVSSIAALLEDPEYQNLRFSFTISSLGGTQTDAINEKGKAVISAIKTNHLEDKVVINLMTMDYGSTNEGNCMVKKNPATGIDYCDMGESAKQAALNLHQQYGIPLSQIAITPMIGGNDTVDEIFTLQDADTVMQFARNNRLAGVHFWAWDRDTRCTSPQQAGYVCNKYDEAGTLDFFNRFTQSMASQ